MLSRQILQLAAARRCVLAAAPALSASASIASSARIPSYIRFQSTHSDGYRNADASSSGFPPSFLQKSRSSPTSRQAYTSLTEDLRTQDDSTQPLSRQEKAELAAHPSDSFHSLKGYVEYDLYKALVDKPFKFEKMSSVQEAVLGLLPELAAPSARGAEKAEVSEDTITTLEDGSTKRGHREISTDLLVKAKTGTGKTVAFLVPALEARVQDLIQEQKRFKAENPTADKNTVSRHMADYRKRSVGAIILSPTRELAAQIATEAVRATHHMKDFGVQLFIGGASKQAQLREFARKRRDIVVATPGRLNDMLGESFVAPSLQKAKMLVFDEADTLLDMGFSDAIREIVKQLPPKAERQTFMFSATLSPEVRQIARETIRKEHTFIDTVPANEVNAHIHIPQYHTILDSPSQQIPHVFRLLAQDALQNAENGGKAIVFLPTTRMTILFSTILNSLKGSMPFGPRGTRIFEMHSKKTQASRDRAAASFRAAKGGYSVLVTSDVSARGVDYPGVTRVIQVGIPPSKENYVHRLGRTGRAGKAGRGDIILLPWEKRYVSHQLQDMPLQAYTADALEADLEKLAEEFDANPTRASRPTTSESSFDRRRFGSRDATPLEVNTPCLPRIQEVKTKLEEVVLPALDELDINDTFASQLGFYVGHAHELKTGRNEVYQGLQEWAKQAFNLEAAPTVSASMSDKLGLGRSVQNRRGGGYRMKGYGAQNGRARAYEDFRGQRSSGVGGRGGDRRGSRY